MENSDNNTVDLSPAAGIKKRLNTIVLDEPIQRGNSTIKEVSVRKPNSGELRGVTLTALSEIDVIALQRVLPRITSPSITTQEIDKMAPSDLLQLGVRVASFLLTKADMVMVSPNE